ncbi:MAG: pilus assembly protein TadG [Alphaproteobacteria bacterium]|nr:pilus assembly protein TadG [Alphaproteobacteria bacterium]MBU1513714.1 pilus assembly protein TadG [Alphaproteobacteria bacterium]MBU2094641.1 pilus assembly protein TadG [Alphaproteobacteria bacterium]MBU2150290.1 pilus assembly protein TadG [Alphaproteobacteria bacterium]MBU2309181.1 pilus assembly protein TadG [Alphaproteobacteria bacterium]
MRRSRFAGIGRLVRRFDNRGNVAIVAALAMGPICVAGLGAVDLARATNAKAELQDALDAAALASARTTSTTDAQLKTAGDRFLAQNLSLGDDFKLGTTSFKFGQNGNVVASASLEVRPFVAGLLSNGVISIEATSEVVRASVKVEIALVLDTTGSMNDGTKLADMKKAAKDFVTKMEEAANKSVEPDSVKISLVPFSNTVRVDGAAYLNAPWVDQAGASPINDEIFTKASGTQHANRLTLFSQIGTAWRGCVEMRKAPYDVQDTAPSTGTPATLYTPYFAPDEPDSKTSGYSDDYENDYLPDGTGSTTNWRVKQGSITKYGGTKRGSMSTTFGPNRGCGVSKMRRLSTSFQAIRDDIQALTADGNTNIPIGMSWGWNTLSPQGPFADGVAYNTPKHQKILVLMTDGENTISTRDTPNDGTYAGTAYIWQGRVIKSNGQPLSNGVNNDTRTQALDYRLGLLCTNMKAKNIEIYTIRVEAGSSTLLQNCASSRDNFYNVTNSSTLTAVFASIAGQIAALHLAR